MSRDIPSRIRDISFRVVGEFRCAFGFHGGGGGAGKGARASVETVGYDGAAISTSGSFCPGNKCDSM